MLSVLFFFFNAAVDMLIINASFHNLLFFLILFQVIKTRCKVMSVCLSKNNKNGNHFYMYEKNAEILSHTASIKHLKCPQCLNLQNQGKGTM